MPRLSAIPPQRGTSAASDVMTFHATDNGIYFLDSTKQDFADEFPVNEDEKMLFVFNQKDGKWFVYSNREGEYEKRQIIVAADIEVLNRVRQALIKLNGVNNLENKVGCSPAYINQFVDEGVLFEDEIFLPSDTLQIGVSPQQQLREPQIQQPPRSVRSDSQASSCSQALTESTYLSGQFGAPSEGGSESSYYVAPSKKAPTTKDKQQLLQKSAKELNDKDSADSLYTYWLSLPKEIDFHTLSTARHNSASWTSYRVDGQAATKSVATLHVMMALLLVEKYRKEHSNTQDKQQVVTTIYQELVSHNVMQTLQDASLRKQTTGNWTRYLRVGLFKPAELSEASVQYQVRDYLDRGKDSVIGKELETCRVKLGLAAAAA